MLRSLFCALSLVLLTGAGAQADTAVKIFETDESLSPATREWKVTVPPFAVEHQVRLGLDVRIDAPSLLGSNPWLRVAINGHFLTKEDLLNKPNEFQMRSGVDLRWGSGDRWRALYSPDFEAAFKQDNPASIVGVDPYRYVWDITRYAKAGENDLQIINLKILQRPTTLVLRNGTIEVGKYQAPPAAPDAVVPAPTGPLQTYVAQPTHRVPLQVRANPGQLELFAAGHTFNIGTRSSLPGGQWQQAPEAAAGLGPTVTNGQRCFVSWQTPSYTVEREVEVREDHIHIADTLTNTTRNLIGVIIEHRLNSLAKPQSVYVAGSEWTGEQLQTHSGAHPSVFAQWKDGGLGMVAEDDIFRAHVQNFRDANAIGLADDELGIEPGKPVTLEWSVYPLQRQGGSNGDYWDFVNAVRRNWDANFAIPGPFNFVGSFGKDTAPRTAAWYGNWMRQRSLKIVAGGIHSYKDGGYAHGTGILYAPESVAKETDWIQKVHQGAPEVKAVSYFHAQICTEPDGETKYAADGLYDAAGTHLSYPGRNVLPLYVPTRENAYGKALWGFVKTCLDKVGADGLYWDEMSNSVVEYAYGGPWDGHTVIIDKKTHEITGKRSSVPLLIQPLQLDIVHYLRDHGKFLMGNTQPVTRTMAREKVVRFVETGTYSALNGTHLGCPLGLGNHHSEATQADSATNVRQLLQRGTVYYGHIYTRDPAPWNFTSVMFPITPTRLGPGFVIGEERIHTTVSGRFGFQDGKAAEVYVIDAQGARAANPQVKEDVIGGKFLYEIRIPSDQFAVLVKK